MLNLNTAPLVVLCTLAFWPPALGQVSPTILTIDVDDVVQYIGDVSDVTKFATDPTATNASPRSFQPTVSLADIVAVNGQSAKGVLANSLRLINLRTSPNSGEAISDVVRNSFAESVFEILRPDGTPIGSIMAYGLSGGAAPPGSPSAVTQQNSTITGGTGAFLGARGQVGTLIGGRGPGVSRGARQASMAEDPRSRRAIQGGGRIRWILTVIPMFTPQIVSTGSGPAVFHADFSPVTAANPGRVNEVLIVKAMGLGPTRPGVEPGQPFPSDTILEVNSPVSAIVNGQPAEVVNAVGWPGQLDTYRVDFRVPGGIGGGTTAIRLTAAWIAGPPVTIPIQ